MRLVKKKQIFCNSRDRVSGDRGNFTIRFGKLSEPGEYKHKIYLQQFVIRNDFDSIIPGYNTTFAYYNSNPGAPSFEKRYEIPVQHYTVDSFVRYLNTVLGTHDPTVGVLYESTTGSLIFNGANTHTFDFTEQPATAELFGFSSDPNDFRTWIVARGMSPPSPVAIEFRRTLDVRTNLGGDRFETNDRGEFSHSSVIASASLDQVQFMGDLKYEDVTGANGVFISADIDNLDSFEINLRDDYQRSVFPKADWPFIVAIEFWWDPESMQIAISKQIATQLDTANKLLQIIAIALDKDEQLPPPPDEYPVMAMDIPGMVPFGWRLPDDLFAGKRARFNTLI